MRTHHIIGVMSGTSLDGLDICYVSFSVPGYQFKILETETISYDVFWEEKLRRSVFLPPEELTQLDSEYGLYLAEKIQEFRQRNTITKVDCIASHGHTVFHNPQQKYTLQVGNGAVIAAVTRVKTICDFRSQDVILGGQGAPLVPIGDKLLFSSFDSCLNLGGFSNISFEKKSERIAFDICPVNVVLNYLASREGKPYDYQGGFAREGTVDPELLEILETQGYYRELPPKSLGMEWVFKNIYPLLKEEKAAKDLLTTYTIHVAQQISKVINENGITSVLVTGGGAKNNYLIELIQARISAKIYLPEEKLIDYKEALVFALLGLLKMEKQINVLSSVTGASQDHSSGVVYTP